MARKRGKNYLLFPSTSWSFFLKIGADFFCNLLDKCTLGRFFLFEKKKPALSSVEIGSGGGVGESPVGERAVSRQKNSAEAKAQGGGSQAEDCEINVQFNF